MLRLFRRGRSSRFACRRQGYWSGLIGLLIPKGMDRADCMERSAYGPRSGESRARLIWVNERSNPQVMDRFAAFRLQDIFRRPP